MFNSFVCQILFLSVTSESHSLSFFQCKLVCLRSDSPNYTPLYICIALHLPCLMNIKSTLHKSGVFRSFFTGYTHNNNKTTPGFADKPCSQYHSSSWDVLKQDSLVLKLFSSSNVHSSLQFINSIGCIRVYGNFYINTLPSAMFFILVP